jgi:hypothetical protein
MGGKKWLVLALLVAAGPVWGQSEKQVTAAVGEQMDAYAACLKRQAETLAKSTESPDVIIDRAIKACAEDRQALWAQLQKPPLSATADDATGAVKQATDELRPQMLESVKKARGV